MTLFEFLKDQPFFKNLSTGNLSTQIMRGKIFLNGKKISALESSPKLSHGDKIDFKGFPLNNWTYQEEEKIEFLPFEGEFETRAEKSDSGMGKFRNGDVLQVFNVLFHDGTNKFVRISAKRMWTVGFEFSDEFSDDELLSLSRDFVENHQKMICGKLLSVDPGAIKTIDSFDFDCKFSQMKEHNVCIDTWHTGRAQTWFSY